MNWTVGNNASIPSYYALTVFRSVSLYSDAGYNVAKNFLLLRIADIYKLYVPIHCLFSFYILLFIVIYNIILNIFFSFNFKLTVPRKCIFVI